jgi:hypothetical protein
MGPLGHTWFSPFAEPTDNKNFSERKSMFVSTKLEMIHSFLYLHAIKAGSTGSREKMIFLFPEQTEKMIRRV